MGKLYRIKTENESPVVSRKELVNQNQALKDKITNLKVGYIPSIMVSAVIAYFIGLMIGLLREDS